MSADESRATLALQRWVGRYGPQTLAVGALPWALLIVVMLMLLMLLFAVVGDYSTGSVGPLLLAALYGCVILAVARGMSVTTAVKVCVLGGALQVCNALLSHGGIFSPRMGWLLVLPLAPYFFLGRKSGDRWFALMVLAQALILLASVNGWLDVNLRPTQTQTLASYITMQATLVFMILLPFFYDRVHRRAIAEERATQVALERIQSELEVSQAQRDRFIASVSHELRTPMNAIVGFNQLLLERVEGGSEAHKILQHTQYSVEHLMTVINDVLDYSQLQTGQLQLHPQVVDLPQALRRVFALLESRATGQGLRYTLDIDPALPRWVKTDEHRLVQILVNLLGNALKFTPAGSVTLRALVRGPVIELMVCDTGIGIPAEKQSQLFKRFSQAGDAIQQRYGGNGLGLAISLKLAQLLGGDIRFSSTERVGSEFVVSLPLSACNPPTVRVNDGEYAIRTADRPWCFLVVDDHPINRLLVNKVLRNAWPRCTVLEATDGVDALEKVGQHKVDVIFMDMRMPRMDGCEATERIRQSVAMTDADVPIMGLTANVNPDDLERFRSAGLNGLLLKPFDWKKLCEEVDGWLRTR